MLVIKLIIAVWVTGVTTGFSPLRPRKSTPFRPARSTLAFSQSSDSFVETKQSENLKTNKNENEEKEFEPHNIKRSWAGGRGSMQVDCILPKSKDDGNNKNIRGVIIFLHGFSQEPKAYRPSLEQVSNKLQVAIVAPEIDLDSFQVLGDVADRVGNLFYCLQRALAFDGIQCLNMTLNRQEPFSDFLPTSPFPVGVAGHSMGAGLSWFVASQFSKEISYVAAMAPLNGVPAFAPNDRNVPRQSLHAAGSWDFLAKPLEVQNLTHIANTVHPNSSIYVEIARGTHTGFEDEPVLFNISIENAIKVLGNLEVIGFLFSYLLIYVVERVLTNKVQANLTRALLEYTFDCMIQAKPVSAEDLWTSLKSNPDVTPEGLARVTVDQKKEADK
jgi:hypothetical protein